MKSFKLLVQIMMLAAVTASVAACSKSGSKSSARPRSNYRAFDAGVTAPGSNPQNVSSQWGEIIGFNRQSLAAFLGVDQTQFGDVSAQSNQQTGIRFYGNINSSGYGKLYMFVYDSYAVSKGVIELPEFTCQGSNQNGTIVISCKDNSGDLVLRGTEIGNEFSGQVYFDNNNSLGQFRISSCGFLGC